MNESQTREFERRRHHRRRVTCQGPIPGIRLTPGLEGALRDLSESGASVEVGARLLPGSMVEVQVALAGRHWRGRARVVRCRVSALIPGAGVQYTAALDFGEAGDARCVDSGRLVAIIDALERGQ